MLLNPLTQALQIIVTAIATYLLGFAAIGARIRAQEARLRDLEAYELERKREWEAGRQRWDGIYAAYVGNDLEEIEGNLTEAILAYSRGEDINAALYDIHSGVCCIMADITTGKEDA